MIFWYTITNRKIFEDNCVGVTGFCILLIEDIRCWTFFSTDKATSSRLLREFLNIWVWSLENLHILRTMSLNLQKTGA